MARTPSWWRLDPAAATSMGWQAMVHYSVLGFGCGAPHFLFLLYFMKYGTDVLRLDAALLGLIFTVSRTWDALTDLGTGWLSDGTRSRWGRRRPWIAAGGALMALTVLMLWAPPDLEHDRLGLWIGVACVAYFTAHTMVLVPYNALAVELWPDDARRTKIFAYRHVAYFFSMGLGLVALNWLSSAEDTRDAGRDIAMGMAALTLLSMLVFVVPLRELSPPRSSSMPAFWPRVRRVLANRKALRIYVLLFIEGAGTTALSALGAYVTAYLIGDESALPLLVGIYVGASLLFTPLVPKLAARFGPRQVWSVSILLSMLAFAALHWVRSGDLTLLMVCAVFVGIGDACAYVLGRALLASYMRDAEGEQEDEGLYFAMWSFSEKLAYGVMVGLVGWALSAANYSPENAHLPEVEVVLRSAISALPASAYAVGFLLSLGLPARKGPVHG